MGVLLDQGTYLQAHLWHLSLVFQQPWEEVMHSSLCWVKDNLRNGEIRYFTLNHNQPPCDRNFSSNPGPCPVSDVIREEDYGTGVDHSCSPGMGDIQGVDQEKTVETSAVVTRLTEGEELTPDPMTSFQVFARSQSVPKGWVGISKWGDPPTAAPEYYTRERSSVLIPGVSNNQR